MYGGINSESTPQTMIITVDLSSYIPAWALFLSWCTESVGNRSAAHTNIMPTICVITNGTESDFVSKSSVTDRTGPYELRDV